MFYQNQQNNQRSNYPMLFPNNNNNNSGFQQNVVTVQHPQQQMFYQYQYPNQYVVQQPVYYIVPQYVSSNYIISRAPQVYPGGMIPLQTMSNNPVIYQQQQQQQQPLYSNASQMQMRNSVSKSSLNISNNSAVPSQQIGVTSVNGIQNQQNNFDSNDILLDEDSPKRCLKCGKYYRERDNCEGSCVYHPGNYYASTRMLGTFASWSCCKAVDRDSTGCRVEQHKEDIQTSAILAKFNKPPPYPSSQNRKCNEHNQNVTEGLLIDFSEKVDDNQQNTKGSEQNLLAISKDQEPIMDDEGYYIIEHQVGINDTLAGIAVQYGTTTNEIKSFNNLFSDNVFSKKVLKIRTKKKVKAPKKQEETKEHLQNRLIRRFVLMTHAKPEEAAFYLSNHSWQFRPALSNFKDDMQWERDNVDKMKKRIVNHK